MQSGQIIGFIDIETRPDRRHFSGGDRTLASTFHRLVTPRQSNAQSDEISDIGKNRITQLFEDSDHGAVIFANVHELTRQLREEFNTLSQRFIK
jgi:hypothetical protein